MAAPLLVSARTLRVVLWSSVAVATLLSLPAPFFRHVMGHDYVHGFVPFAKQAFGLNTEGNLPTWVATALLLIASLFLLIIGLATRTERRPWSSHWLGLAAIFVYVSADEAAQIHEQANRVRDFLGAGGIFYFA